MAKDPQLGYKVVATVTDVKGRCNAEHYIGESFQISIHDTGGLFGSFYHNIFPSLQTFQFGGSMPWWQGDSIQLQCPYIKNLVTIKLDRFNREI
jgi:uncharacterized repeat protein (TIGR04076 family)